MSDWKKTIFDKHEITVICDTDSIKRFKFSAPDTWCYGFFLTTSDNLIVMNGDIGTLVVEPGYGRDGLAFLRGSLKSTGYFLSKIPYPFKDATTEYCRKLALEGIKEFFENDYISEAQLKDFEEQLTDDYSGEYAEMKYYELCYELKIEEPPRATKRTGQTEVQLLGLEKFLEKLDKP